MAAMVTNEFYGVLPRTLLSEVKRYNVSPSDYFTLEEHCHSFSEMEDAIVTHSIATGSFQVYKFLESIGRW